MMVPIMPAKVRKWFVCDEDMRGGKVLPAQYQVYSRERLQIELSGQSRKSKAEAVMISPSAVL